MAAVTYTAQRGLKLLGDEKGAWMADTTAETITGSELVTNGDFATDISGWTTVSGVSSWSSGTINIKPTNYQGSYQQFTVTIGKAYIIEVEVTAISVGSARVYIGTSSNVLEYVNDPSKVAGKYFYTVTPTESTLRITLATTNQTGDDVNFDNIKCRLAVPDLSTNDNGLGVYGSITKSAVATGSELVAYSGFSSSNYLEQPYNADLDFGTGDFCFMGWIKETGSVLSNQNPIQSGQSTTYSINILRETSSGSRRIGFYVAGASANTGNIYSAVTMTTGAWVFVSLMRRSGLLELYVNGVLSVTNATDVGTLTPSSTDTFRVGYGTLTTTTVEVDCSVVRTLAYAPTAAQINAIYESEKHLFRKYSTYTQADESYSFDLPVQSAIPSTSTIKTDNVSLGGIVETIVDRDDVELDITTGLLHRTDATETRVSQFEEFMFGTRASESFTMDLYGSVASEDEPKTYIRIGQHDGPTPEGNGGNWFRGSFKAREQ